MIQTHSYRILREPANIDPTGGVVTIQPKAEATPAPAAPAPAPKATPAKQKPQAPREPTADELKGDFKIEPGDAGFVDSFDVEQLPKKEEPKKEEKKEVVAKTEPDPVEPDAEVVVEDEEPEPVIDLTKPIAPVGTVTKQRDYAGFSPEEVKVLKGMSNDSFAYTSNLIKQNKELAQLKDASYLQHPNAYVLDPQYQQEQLDAQFFQQEGEYWQQQLMLIAEGKAWKPLLEWKNGQPVFGPERVANRVDEEQVRMAMNQAFNAAQQSKGKLQQLATGYNQRVQSGHSAIQSEREKRFGWVSDPKILEQKIKVGEEEKSIKAVREDMINMLPPYRRNDVLAELAADLFASLMIYGHQIQVLQSRKKVAAIKQEEVHRAEPTSKVRPANNGHGKAINGVKEFNMEGVTL